MAGQDADTDDDDLCSTGTIDEYIAWLSRDPEWARLFAQAQQEVEEWLASSRQERSASDGE
jgi:hypothetical protein